MIDETLKYVERTTMDRADQLREADKPKPPRKEGKSPFDELLEQSKQLQRGAVDTKTQTNKTTTQQAVQELEKRQEKFREQSKDKEKEEEHKQETKDERTQTGFVGRKIVGKTGLKQQQGDSSGKGSEGDGFGSKKGEKSLLKSKKSSAEDPKIQNQIGSFGKALQVQMSKFRGQVPKTLSQDVLNQLCRYVRVGLSREGFKELELHLHEKIFKGLRLRLTSNRGRVSVHFLTANAQVRSLFEREASKIKEELVAKGVAVEKIQVT